MKLSVMRLDEQGRYETTIVRGDGVRFMMRGPDCTFAMPHDIVHYVVEKALGLEHGFWARVAAGGVFPSMSYVDGRRKPKAAERSRLILKADPDRLSEAEVLVRIFGETIQQGHGERAPALSQQLKERRVPPGRQSQINPDQVSNIFAAYRELLSRWKNLPVGGSIELNW